MFSFNATEFYLLAVAAAGKDQCTLRTCLKAESDGWGSTHGASCSFVGAACLCGRPRPEVRKAVQDDLKLAVPKFSSRGVPVEQLLSAMYDYGCCQQQALPRIGSASIAELARFVASISMGPGLPTPQ
jgi:hypothetical protein